MSSTYLDPARIFDVSDIEEKLFSAIDAWLETGVSQDEVLAEVFKLPETTSIRGDNLTIDGDAIARKVQAEMRLYMVRDHFVKRYGFIVPTRSLTEEAASLGSLLEVGAGTGFLSKLIAGAGGNVVATDVCAPKTMNNFRQVVGRHYPVERMDAATAVAMYPHHVVVLAYPDNAPWCEDVLATMQPGQKLLYLGERGGCCGTDRFVGMLGAHFDTERNLDLFRFPGLREVAQVLRKRSVT